ncbi:MAG TPA: NlpC/P60 family protein [Chitinophagaceae bacterium]|nr:NlpC/P60 family protein [Chitinophagaceae bacterium]HNF71010.1 NlpC/P60 family protein [Chitinophagaceae bacterium]
MKPLLFFPILLISFSACQIHKKHIGSKEASGVSAGNTHRLLQEEVKNWLGVPYQSGGMNRNGVDCSGLVCILYQKVYHQALPRTTQQQFRLCQHVSRNNLREGDLVFFRPGTREVSHVGLYLAADSFVHASLSKGVVISSLKQTYYARSFISAGRWVPDKRP